MSQVFQQIVCAFVCVRMCNLCLQRDYTHIYMYTHAHIHNDQYTWMHDFLCERNEMT